MEVKDVYIELPARYQGAIAKIARDFTNLVVEAYLKGLPNCLISAERMSDFTANILVDSFEIVGLKASYEHRKIGDNEDTLFCISTKEIDDIYRELLE